MRGKSTWSTGFCGSRRSSCRAEGLSPLRGCWRSRWAAYVLGGSLAVLGVLFTPQAFDALSELFSLSQSRRLAAFLPLPFALAGAATVLGRLRLGGALAALGVGGILQLEYPGEFTYRVVVGGPAWPVWVALVGGLAALLVGIVLRRGFVEAGPGLTRARAP